MKFIITLSGICILMILPKWTSVCFGAIPAIQNKTVESQEQYFYVRGNGVILHRSPGIKARSIARVDSGAICKGIYHIGEWVQVKFDNDREGFIHQSQLSPCTQESSQSSRSDQNLITNLIDDSINSVLSEQLKKINKTSATATLWMWIAIFSLIVNGALVVLILKEILEKKKALKDYIDFKELATIQKSRETLYEEVDLLRRANKNLEKKILQLAEKLKKE